MFNWFKKLFKRNSEEYDANTDIDKILDELINDPDYHDDNDIETLINLKDPEFYGNLDSKKTLLLVDDQDIVFTLYEVDFIEIKQKYNFDILKEYKIVKCSGPEAGFIAMKYLFTSDDEVVIAILDLTLGKIVKLGRGNLYVIDGVDIALEIFYIYPKCKVLFCTAHMLTNDNPNIHNLIEKFKQATNKNLLEYTFSKNSNRTEYIYRAIQEIENKDYVEQVERVWTEN